MINYIYSDVRRSKVGAEVELARLITLEVPPYAFNLVIYHRRDALSDSVPRCNYTLKQGFATGDLVIERSGASSKEKVVLNTRNIGRQIGSRRPILAHLANVDAVRIDVWVSDLVLESDPGR